MSLETAQPFIVEPSGDLLQKAPHLGHLARQLSLKYVHREVVSDTALLQLGQLLWQALDIEEDFNHAFSAAKPRILPVVIISNSAEIFGLPWEVLHHPQIGFLGHDPRVTLTRQLEESDSASADLGKGPLRVLLFTALASHFEEKGRLDIEAEQENVLEALTPWVQAGWVSLEVPFDGRFTSFQRLISQGNFHLVFLSGHGEFKEDHLNEQPTQSFFLFEGNHDRGDSRQTDEIAACFAGQSVTRAVVLSACQSGRTASDNLSTGLAMGLIEQGIPLVIGMRESIFDRAGIIFARAFCDAIGNRQRIDVALQKARNAMAQEFKFVVGNQKQPDVGGEELSMGQWCLPALYARTPDSRLIDWQFEPQPPSTGGYQLYDSYSGVEFPRRFIGRRRELTGLLEDLESGHSRLVMISGAGGMGKTALAGRLAQIFDKKGYLVLTYPARQESPWKQFSTNLHLALDADLSEKINHSWGQLPDRKAQYSLLVKALMQQTGGRLVLLLDNLETVQEAETRQLTDPELAAWLKACLAIGAQAPITLLTSRWQVLGLQGESVRHHPLEPASYGDFLRYTQEVLTERLPRDTLREVYHAVGGNFKGLQFFAKVSELGSDQKVLLNRLSQAQDELRIYAALDDLFVYLEPEEQSLLVDLTAYDSPVIEDGVFMLAGDLASPEAMLDKFVAYSLLDVSVDFDLKLPCYSLSPVLSQWLKDTNPSQEPGVLKRAAEYQLWIFEHLKPTIAQVIIAHQALVKSNQDEKAHQLVLDYLVVDFKRKGIYQGLQTTWLPPLLESSSKNIRGSALNQLGICYLSTGDYDMALDNLKQSLGIQREIGDRAGEGATLNNISQIYQARGDYDTALDYLKQSLGISREIGDRAGEGATLSNMAAAAHARGDYDTALEYLKQSLYIQGQIGDRAGEGATLNNISLIYQARGDYDTALDYLGQSLGIRREIGDRAGEGTTLSNMATAAHDRGDYDTALEYLKQSLDIQRQIGDRAGEGTTLNNISQIYQDRGDYDTALDYLKQSLGIQRQIGDRAGMCPTLFNMGHLHLQNKEPQEAMSAWLTVYDIAKELQLAEALIHLESLAQQMGQEGLGFWEQMLEKMRS